MLTDFRIFCDTFYDFWNAKGRRDVPVGVPLDLSTPTGMSSIGTCGENFKSDNVPKYRGLLVAFLLLWHEKLMSRKLINNYLFYFLFSEN